MDEIIRYFVIPVNAHVHVNLFWPWESFSALLDDLPHLDLFDDGQLSRL